MKTEKQNKTRSSEFSKLDCTDTQPITTTNTTCNFTYIGIVCIQVDKKPDFFFHSKLEKQVNSRFSRLGGFWCPP